MTSRPTPGLSVPLARLDPTGTAWVQTMYPLQFYVAGPTPGPVWARLTFHATVPVSVPRQAGVTVRRAGGTLVACVRATGTAPQRRVSLSMSAPLTPGPEPPETFAPAMPLEGVQSNFDACGHRPVQRVAQTGPETPAPLTRGLGHERRWWT